MADQVRQGKDSARLHAEDAIRRHEASALGAYVCFDAEGAREQADRIDAAVARGQDPGRLAGVTVSVKDLYGVEGLPIRAGTKRELPPKWRREGFLVRSLRSLGAVIVGKTHTVELAFGGVGLNPNTGTPVNPWDAEESRAPGGSSSGAGASLWEGSARIAVGSDTGGSVRIPASATGVVGHRQTTGRWPTTGVFPLSSTMDTVGLLTRTAEDSLYAFEAIDRLAPGAAGSSDRASGGPSGSACGPAAPGAGATPSRPGPADATRLRIGVLAGSYTWDDAQPDVADVVRAALAELEAAGAVVRDVAMPEWDEAGLAYLSGGLVPPECIEFLEREMPGWPDTLDPTVGKRLEAARDTPAVEYVRILRLRRRLAASIHARMDEEGVDLLATPTVPVTPPPLAELEQLDRYREVNRQMLSATGPAGMLDMCAVSLPAGLDNSRMPVGLQLVGRSGTDVELLQRAVVAEQLLGAGAERLGTPPVLVS